MNALTYEFVDKENYLPVKDNTGNYALYDHRRILQFKQNNNITIVEIIDGDGLSAEEIWKHCNKNRIWITKASATSVPKVIDIYVFSSYPGKMIEEAMSRFAIPDYFLIMTDMLSRQAMSLNDMYENSHYVSLANKIFDLELERFKDLKMTYQVIDRYNEEIKYELQPNKMSATYVLMGLNVLIFIVDYIVKYFTGDEVLKNFGVKQSFLITVGEYWRLFTPMLLHADMMHLASNMFSLYILGQTAEKYFGQKKFVAIYFLGGIMGNVFSYTLTQNISLGASGAVFAIGGAVVVLWKMKASRLLRMSGRDMLLVILIAINIISGFGNTGIDNWAHLGGLIGGFLIAFGLGYRNDPIRKNYRVASILFFYIITVSMYAIGYDKWETIISMYR